MATINKTNPVHWGQICGEPRMPTPSGKTHGNDLCSVNNYNMNAAQTKPSIDML